MTDAAPLVDQTVLIEKQHIAAVGPSSAVVALGVDFLKVQSMLGREAYFAIAQAARREHITFVGHVPDRVTATEAADAGQHSIEHFTNVLRGCSRDEPKLMREQLYIPLKQETSEQSHRRIVDWQHELLDSYWPEKAANLVTKFKEKDVWQMPTLILLKNDAFPTTESLAARDARGKYIPRERSRSGTSHGPCK